MLFQLKRPRLVLGAALLAAAVFAAAVPAAGSASGPVGGTGTTITAGPTTGPSGALPHNPCTDVLEFGLVEVYGGTASNPQPTLCPNGTGGYVPTGGVEINGIVLTASAVTALPNGSIVFDPTASTVKIDAQALINSVATGPAANTLGTWVSAPLVLAIHPDNHGAAPQSQQVTGQTGGGSIGGFHINGGLTLTLTLTHAPGGDPIYGTELGLTVKLPSIFSPPGGGSGGVAGSIVVRAANADAVTGAPDSTGLAFAGAKIVIGTPGATTGGILLGPAQVTYLCLSYTGGGSVGSSCQISGGAGFVATFSGSCPSSPGDAWDGRILIKIPPTATGLLIDAAAGTKAGHFAYAAALVSGLNAPIYPSVKLDKLGFGICVISTAGGGLRLGGTIGLKIASVIDGDITLIYQTTKNPVLSGKTDTVVTPNAPFDSLPTRWYFDLTGALTIAGSGGAAGPSIGSSEVYIDPHAIGLTGQFGGTWTVSGSSWVLNVTGTAAASISAAVSAQVSLTNNAFNIFTHIWASASGSLTMNTTLAGFGVSLSASANASGNGTLAVSDFGFGSCLNLSGSLSGHVSATHYVGWPYYGTVTVASANASLNFNFALGVAEGFVSQSTPNLPAGYQSGWHLFWGACDIAPYEDVHLSGHAPASQHSTTASEIPLTIGKGQRGQLISVIGKNGPPQITITAPDGEQLSTPTEAKGRPSISPHMIVFVNTASNQTFIALGKPPAGRYTIAAKPGSTPIIGVRRADVLPQPQVSATVSDGSGRTRVLHYSIESFTGQSVQFFEQSAPELGGGGFAALGPVQGVTKSGEIRFSSADGPRGPRTILALVSQRGLPRTEFAVATYTAPGRITATNAGKG